MQKKDNKVGNKTAYKEERQTESEGERNIEIDSKTKWLVRMREKSDRISRKIQLTLDNSNLALTRTKIDFPWISFIYLL